jgi:hypothetical protein
MTSYKLHDHANKVTRQQMTMQRVALHLLTDFRPWAAPPGAHIGFLPFVASMLSQSPSKWETHRNVEHYEKQWRPVISWLIGSAFSREAIDFLGWSAAIPVSVLASSQAGRGPWPKYLAAALTTPVVVQRKRKGLMPDYLAVPTGSLSFAFFESKGGQHPTITSKKPGSKLTKQLTAWTQQVCNARLIVNGHTQAVERWIAATRVHPGARSRETYVRLWKVLCAKNEPSETHVDAPPDDGSSEIETNVAQRERSVAALAAISRAVTLHHLGLNATAEAVAVAAARLGAQAQGRQNAAAHARAVAELDKLASVGSGSHPEQPQENQQITSTEADVPASQVRETTTSAQDENHTPYVAATDQTVRRISTFAFGRNNPRVHLGLLSSGLEDLQVLARAAVDPPDEIATQWRARPRTEVRDPVIEGATGAARADGFVAWIEPS